MPENQWPNGPKNGRPQSFEIVRKLLAGKRKATYIEVGSTRERDDMGAGYSTPFFAWLSRETDSFFFSLDVKPDVTQIAREILAEMGLLHGGVFLITTDAMAYFVEWATNFRQGLAPAIDFLYLDGWDYSGTDSERAASETQHLIAFNLIEPCLADGAVILIDDIHDPDTFVGKGRLLIPSLIERGYECVYRGYQFAFTKPTTNEDAQPLAGTAEEEEEEFGGRS